MTVSIIGPRSSTPKVSAPPRTLPKAPRASQEPKKAPKTGRALPPVPKSLRSEGIKPSRSLPRVPGPVQANSPVNVKNSKNGSQNPAIPTIPKGGQRVLPKIPKLNIASLRVNNHVTQRKGSDALSDQINRKEHLHEVYRAEADDYLREGDLDKARESYNAALKLVPDNKSTLVARSRCYQLLGKPKKAMHDVESALNLDPLFHEALYQKAELHYQQRDYEMALVYYSKGAKQRPDIRAFQEGLEKTQDAINSSNTERTKRMAKAGDMSFFLPKKKAAKKKPSLAPLLPSDLHQQNHRDVATPGFRLRHQNPLVRIERGSRESLLTDAPSDIDIPKDDDITETRMKQILGRMYNDKKYLEQLVNQAEGLHSGSVDLHSMAENGLDFLYDRVLYWVRQGRIIPPEAPILQLPKPTAAEVNKSKHDRTGGFLRVTSPRSDESTNKAREPRPRLLRKLDQDQGMQPSSWFRYLERKKMAEVNTRKGNQTKFLHVLEGQRLDLKDSNMGFSTTRLSPLRTKRSEKDEKKDTKKKKKGKHMKDKDNLSSSDADSGLNISFATYKQPSDLNFDVSEGSVIGDTIMEERPPRRKVISPKKSKVSKKSRVQSMATEREQLLLFINREMDDIEMAYVEGHYNECINRAESCLNVVTSYPEDTIPNIMGIIAKLHSYIGNAAIENKDYVTALDHHERDLQIGEEGDDEEAMSRALGNLGRIHVFQNDHQKALELFSRKVPLCRTRLETAWLYHEIGNCFLVLGQYKFAMEAALRSLNAAEEAVEWSYQLQALVLLGVAEVKLKNFSNAVHTFERARDQARQQGDVRAEEAITEALHDVNDKIIESIKSARGDVSRSGRVYSRSRNDISDKTSYHPRSRAEWSEYSSIFIPEDDGDVSLTETGYDSDYLHLDLDKLHSGLDTSMFGSHAHLRSDRVTSRITDRRTLRSAQPTPSAQRSNMTVASAATLMRNNTAVG